jgi:mono/diheme cytochrome c family protein
MRTLIVLAVIAAIGVVGGAVVVWSGIYNVAATSQHIAPVYRILEVAMRRSVVTRARHIAVPDLSTPVLRDRGMQLFRDHCVACHGAPGIAPQPFALGMLPVPANLVLTARQWSAAEIFWVVKHGVKTTGMPAWTYRMPDADLWAVVAFVTVLPTLSPKDYAQQASRLAAPAAREARADPASSLPEDLVPADAVRRGKAAMQQYACVSCHIIPGVVGADMPVGPPLTGIASRKYLAGVLPNSPGNMVRWLRAPQEISPGSAMPDLDVPANDARDMAAFLGTLH